MPGSDNGQRAVIICASRLLNMWTGEERKINMRLYKMELYKLCHRKIFIIGALCVIGFVLFAFGVQVIDEEATVDGIRYTGYRAVQVNRRITEEFKGILTDEKVERIVEKYGFPHTLESGWGYFRDANFLNQFVMDYLSDGYIIDLDEYRVAAVTYPIADSDLGEVIELSGKDIVLEYYHGWNAFLEVLSIGMIIGSILILISLSVIFAGEGQAKMLSLLFTAKEGRKRDISAKIAAAFTVSLGIWTVIFFTDLILCGVVYGYDGLNCYNGMVVSYLFPWGERMIPMYYYIIMAITLSFFGVLFLCAITICISAYCKSSFQAVTIAALCWGMPVLAAMFAGGFYGIAKFLSAAPVFMVIYRTIDDIYYIWLMPVGIAVILSLCCTINAYRKYKRQQVG